MMSQRSQAKADGRELVHEMLEELRLIRATNTAIDERGKRSQIKNNVLLVELVRFPAEGYIVRDFHVTVGSIGVINHDDTNSITYQTGTGGGSAPGNGVGIQRVEPQSFLTIPVGDRSFTLFGTSGEACSVQVFTVTQEKD
jgi:hypothetical protein